MLVFRGGTKLVTLVQIEIPNCKFSVKKILIKKLILKAVSVFFDERSRESLVCKQLGWQNHRRLHLGSKKKCQQKTKAQLGVPKKMTSCLEFGEKSLEKIPRNFLSTTGISKSEPVFFSALCSMPENREQRSPQILTSKKRSKGWAEVPYYLLLGLDHPRHGWLQWFIGSGCSFLSP